MDTRRLGLFASGSPDPEGGGGTGLLNIIGAQMTCQFRHELPFVVSNHEGGSVHRIAHMYGMPFIHMPEPYTLEHYEEVFHSLQRRFGYDGVAFLGFLRMVFGCNSLNMVNTHPGPEETAGMYGRRLYEWVLAARDRGELTHNEVNIHFMTDTLDDMSGRFYRGLVKIKPHDTWRTLKARTQKHERRVQPYLFSRMLEQHIAWDGKNAASMIGAVLD